MRKKEILARGMDRLGINFCLRRLNFWTGLIVLNYHRIGSPLGSLFDHNLWSATQEDFDQQVRFAKKNFDVISINDVEEALTKPKQRSVLFTFDDGYLDNYELAFPVLKSHNVPGTFFITSGFLDNRIPAWWDEIAWMVKTSLKHSIPASEWTMHEIPLDMKAVDRLNGIYYALPNEKTPAYLEYLAEVTGSGRCSQSQGDHCWMTWDMAREMVAGGMEIGAHTVNHPILARLSEADQLKEVQRSKARIEKELNLKVNTFSYPVGRPNCFDEGTRRSLESCDIQFGFSYYGDYNPTGDFDRFDIRRYAVESELSLPYFRTVLTHPKLFAKGTVRSDL